MRIRLLLAALALPFILAPNCPDPSNKPTMGWLSKYSKGKSVAQMEDEICRKHVKFLKYNFQGNGCIYKGLRRRRNWCAGGEKQDRKDIERLYKLEFRCRGIKY